jgi:HAD superfamily hydrolase (TIGR01509 family)
MTRRNHQELQAVVFDLDGLMVNTEELYEEVGSELLRRRGCQFTGELLDAMMGRRTPVALQIMIDWHKLDATVPQLEAESDEIFPAILDHRLAMMPGLADLLASLEQAVLSRLDLLCRFEFLLTAGDVTRGKPEPEVYLKACSQLGLPPHQVMVLEDSENGCKAAIAAGTFAVAVPGFHSRKHSFAGTRFIANTLADPRIYSALDITPPLSS